MFNIIPRNAQFRFQWFWSLKNSSEKWYQVYTGSRYFGLLLLGSQLNLGHYKVKLKVKKSFFDRNTFNNTSRNAQFRFEWFWSLKNSSEKCYQVYTGRRYFGLLLPGSQLTLGHYEVKLKVKMSFSSTQTCSITRHAMHSFVLNVFEAWIIV